MIDNRYQYLSNLSHMSRMNKRTSYKYTSVWYCTILPLTKLSTSSNNSEQSGFWF